MPQCQSCSVIFPNFQVIDGKRRNLQRRKFCVNCSPFGDHNTRKSVAPISIASGYKMCCTCKQSRPFSDFYFATKERTSLRYDCKACANQKVIEWQRDLKQQCVDFLGGKCVVCNYSRSLWGFDFHHLDPTQKDFEISSGRARKFETIKHELEKCVLMCATCHRETHAGLYPQYLIVKDQTI